MEQNNLEKICRTYAFVEARDNPYDEKLSQLQKNIQNRYDNAKSSYSKNQGEIKKIMKELEGASSGLGELFPTFKSIFNGDREFGEINELSSSLISSKDKLSSLQKLVNDSYNKNAVLVYELSAGMKQVENFIELYEKDFEETGKNLENLYNLHNNPEKLKEYVSEIVDKKQGKISKDKRKELINYLIAQGEEGIANLSKKYLKIKNDLPIAQSLLSYKPLIEKYNELTDSSEVIRKRLNEDITKVEEVILIYEIITKSEIDYLKNINLPDKYVEAVNNLVSGMEKIEDKFADKLLENYFSNGKSSRIYNFNVSEVVHGLLKHVKQKEIAEENGK